MLNGNKEGGREYVAKGRRLADFVHFDVGLFNYRGDRLQFGGITTYVRPSSTYNKELHLPRTYRISRGSINL